jgi:hypothetical protein
MTTKIGAVGQRLGVYGGFGVATAVIECFFRRLPGIRFCRISAKEALNRFPALRPDSFFVLRFYQLNRTLYAKRFFHNQTAAEGVPP